MSTRVKPDFSQMSREEVESLAEAGDCHAEHEFYLRCAQAARPQEAAKAMHHLLHAASSGLAAAQFEVGSVLYSTATVEEDYRAARHWYLLAIKQGHVEAKIHLGTLYLAQNTPKILRNHKAGMTLLREAADAGHAEAQYNLGVAYVFGDKPNVRKGLAYLTLAADKGVAQAHFALGRIYKVGIGVSLDLEQAARHYFAAGQLGYPPARTFFSKVLEEIAVRDGKAQADQLVADLMPKLSEKSFVVSSDFGSHALN